MTDLGVLGQLCVIGGGLWLAYTGGRMLIAPRSLRKESMQYRFMAYRLGLLSKTTAKTGQLSHRQIRGYGVWLVFLGLVLIVFSLL